MSDYVSVQVVAKFGDSMPIGELRILKSALPPSPDYCFALGFRALKVTDDGKIHGYELLEVAPVSDANYASYVTYHLQADSTQ